jgi:signal transduction histidine kinase
MHMTPKQYTVRASGDAVTARANALLSIHQHTIWRRTDRLLAGLLMCEWIACTLLARLRSPFAFDAGVRSVHPHVWAAFLLGGAIIAMPVFLVLRLPGHRLTRHVVAAGQMLMSGLLIHLGDGRIEMHFHIFGSLAFIAFYRDWRVLITATVVVVGDHLLRGLFMPLTIYGVQSASLWRTFEHAGWVIFEDIFLIGACVQGVEEMRGIATNRALLEHSYNDVEHQVAQRTQELKNTQAELMKSARSAGMAEIATSVLHNVGNVLNSVNVSATIVAGKLKESEIPSLAKVSELLASNQNDLGQYITADERGKLIPSFLADLANCLGDEQKQMIAEVENLARGIEHIKQVVASQQQMAKSSNVNSAVKPADLFNTAISIQGPATTTGIEFVREFEPVEAVTLDQHKVLQILINLVSNARHAVISRPVDQRRITLRVKSVGSSEGDRLRFQVHDTGVGISPENLTRIFSHGFTTKKEGHGFGLHSAANAAREMGGSLSASSDGVNLGATFTLDLPLRFVSQESACNR